MQGQTLLRKKEKKEEGARKETADRHGKEKADRERMKIEGRRKREE